MDHLGPVEQHALQTINSSNASKGGTFVPPCSNKKRNAINSKCNAWVKVNDEIKC